VTVLVLGILSLVGCNCFILGIIAWAMAVNDLRDMKAGVMDPSGEGMTTTGKVLGIVSVVLAVGWAVFAAFATMMHWAFRFGHHHFMMCH